MTLTPGTHEFASWQGTVGGVSSVKVPAGLTVTMFDQGGCTGASTVYTADSSSLPRFNDKARCIKVEAVATLYGGTSYGGNSMNLGIGTYDLPTWQATVGGVSSIRVGNGIRVTVYKELGQQGASESFTQDIDRLKASNDGHSIRIEAVQ